MVDPTSKPRRRNGRGRAGRIAAQQAMTGNEAVRGGLSGGRYRPLSELDQRDM